MLSRGYRSRQGLLDDNRGGVALILVVWVMVILIAMVANFSYSMRTEIRITQNFKEEEEAYQLALAGFEYAKAEIGSIDSMQEMSVTEDGVLVFDQDVPEPVRSRNLGKGKFEYTITDDDGKLDINTADHDMLKYVFVESGVDMDEAAVIADSIMDWRDTNDLHMLNGAEEDYYQDLDAPYSCKDGKFDSLEELLLVKGMTSEIFYGSTDEEGKEIEYNGVADQLTVNGSKQINVNTAPRTVIEAVLGIAAAEDIILRREEGVLTEVEGNGKFASEFFTIISKGTNADGNIKRSIKAVVQNKADKLEILYWNDNFIR